ncbi:hypothetical protein PY254_12470 [Rhodanobacter sp. AS-Z3]|uniref:hypothetical protein n=1 Tax=Rhodanobacter sp. AS-Z3 TaxID=3031330 RepID=UPI002479D2A1|nr:hypothetical protein [Rhodanobacter sp. AS-Z3]WEN14049.1 hypothetical protein PY254_12470 [Rhodanobacter sp. AS-Z3]
MTKARFVRSVSLQRGLLAGVIAFAPMGTAAAWQAAMQSATRPPASSASFQQDTQQQKVRDDLHKSQLEQQLHQSVSDNAKRPSANDPRSRAQLDSAEQAQHDRDRAAMQALVNRERDTPASPSVTAPSPAVVKKHGH